MAMHRLLGITVSGLLRVFYTYSPFIKLLWSAAVRPMKSERHYYTFLAGHRLAARMPWLVAMIGHKTYSISVAVNLITGYVHVV